MHQITSQDLPPICIKPSPDAPKELYYYLEKELNAAYTFLSLDLQKDLDMIHDWVNRAYARKFWQLNGSRELIRSTYEEILTNPRAHSFIGCINDQPVAQLDVYGVRGEELENHVEASIHDCGVHLLMLPTRQAQKGWSHYTLKNFQRFYFSFKMPAQLFAEPDHENMHANKLAIETGFRFQNKIELSNKTANLYRISRAEFNH